MVFYNYHCLFDLGSSILLCSSNPIAFFRISPFNIKIFQKKTIPYGSKFSGCHMQDEFGRRWWNTELKARCWFEAPGEITTFTQSDSTEKYQVTAIYCWLCRYAHPPIAHNSWDAFSSAVRPICAPNPAGVGQASPWAQMPTSGDWFKPCFFWGVANPAQRRMCQHQFNINSL